LLQARAGLGGFGAVILVVLVLRKLRVGVAGAGDQRCLSVKDRLSRLLICSLTG